MHYEEQCQVQKMPQICVWSGRTLSKGAVLTGGDVSQLVLASIPAVSMLKTYNAF